MANALPTTGPMTTVFEDAKSRAATLINAGQRELAIVLLRDLLKQRPKDVQVLQMLAVSLQGNEDMAVKSKEPENLRLIRFASQMLVAFCFMAMGAVLYVTGRTKASDLGGLYRKMPITAATFIIGAITGASTTEEVALLRGDALQAAGEAEPPVEGRERKVPLTYRWVPDHFLNELLVDMAKGSDADIVIWDPNARHTISAQTHHMRVDFSAYEGFTVKGYPDTILSRGRIIVVRRSR